MDARAVDDAGLVINQSPGNVEGKETRVSELRHL
jgi:hypothetical protein